MVTGANKGIGHEIVRQLASKGITVVLTARDETRGRAAVEGLHSQGLQNVDFHTLDIAVPESITGFANWLKGKYGGVHILVLIEPSLPLASNVFQFSPHECLIQRSCREI